MKIYEGYSHSPDGWNVSSTLTLEEGGRFSYSEGWTDYTNASLSGGASGTWQRGNRVIIFHAEETYGSVSFPWGGKLVAKVLDDDTLDFGRGWILSPPGPAWEYMINTPVSNTGTVPLTLVLDPWDIRYALAPGESVLIVAKGRWSEGGKPVAVNEDNNEIVFYARNGSWATIVPQSPPPPPMPPVAPFEPRYSELIDRLKSGDRSTFRKDLELLAERFGSFRPLEDVAKLSSENKELLGALLELTKEHGQTDTPGRLSFHSIRLVGPEAIPYIREEWKRNMNAQGLHYLHMCMMDIIGAVPQEEKWRRLMPIIAAREIPLWIEMLQGEKTAFRGLLAWVLGALVDYAPPAQVKQAGESIISLLYDDDSPVQTYAVRGLLSIGDKGLLQDALFRLARVAHDEGPLELLLSVSGNINVNAKDDQGKTALTYAEETGNKKIAEFLKKSGAQQTI